MPHSYVYFTVNSTSSTHHLCVRPYWYILKYHHVPCVRHTGIPYEHHSDPRSGRLDQNLVGKQNSQYPYDTQEANLSLLCLHGCSHGYGYILMCPAARTKDKCSIQEALSYTNMHTMAVHRFVHI